MDDARKIVFRETAVIAAGEAVCVAVMIGVYALIGMFDTTVVFGGLAGAVLAVLNFFFMAIVASLAADKAEQQDVAGGQKLIQGSYPIRLLILAVLLFAFAKSGLCNLIALVLPLVFVRPILTVGEFFRKKGDTSK